MGYNKVNSDEITLEEYRNMATELAVQQRETLDYIASRENDKVDLCEDLDLSERRASTHSVTVTKSYSTWAQLTATYDCTSPNLVSNPRNVQGTATTYYIYSGQRNYTQQSWSYSRLDSGRTLGITSKGYTYSTITGGGRIDNVTIYCEFSYQ